MLIYITVLMDAWLQCHDADVLIESPSAMAGVHIAEALSKSCSYLHHLILTWALAEIPYIRAFTMPWVIL